MRLLVLVFEKINNAQSVIGNLLKILKPGGVFQWDDLDCVDMHVKYADRSNLTSVSVLEQIREICWSKGKYDWLLGLPDILSKAGFIDATLEKFGDSVELVRVFGEQHLMTMEEFAFNLKKAGKIEQATRFYQLIDQAYQEIVGGAALCIPRFVCVARKSAVEHAI